MRWIFVCVLVLACEARKGVQVPATSDDASGSEVTMEGGSVPTEAPPDPPTPPPEGPPASTGPTEMAGEPARTRMRLFLSGHSLTDNPLADDLEALAAAGGKDFGWNQQIGIGSPMRARTKGDDPSASTWPGYSRGKNKTGADMNVVSELRNPQTLGAGEHYDVLVVTERHDILSTLQWESTVDYLRHFHDRLLESSSGATTYFYHAWLGMDKANPAAWIAHEKAVRVAWECSAARVNATLTDGHVLPLPAATALVALVEAILADDVPGFAGATQTRMDLLFNDDVHPKRIGVYFMALVVYASVFKEAPPSSYVPAGVSAEMATAMRTIAWTHVRDYYAANAFAPTMSECRTRVAASCAGFWGLLAQPENISSCQGFFANTSPVYPGAPLNPFIDGAFTPMPAP